MRDLKEILTDHAAWLADGMPVGDCRRAHLYGATLRGADLRCADLRCADLRYADLHSTDLTGADLTGANLTGANLTSADLTGADLTSAILRNAHLRYAHLTRMVGITTRGPLGRPKRTIYAVDHGDRVMVRAGCRWQAADDVIAAIERDYAECDLRGPYIAAVQEMVAEIEARRAVEGDDA